MISRQRLARFRRLDTRELGFKDTASLPAALACCFQPPIYRKDRARARNKFPYWTHYPSREIRSTENIPRGRSRTCSQCRSPGTRSFGRYHTIPRCITPHHTTPCSYPKRRDWSQISATGDHDDGLTNWKIRMCSFGIHRHFPVEQLRAVALKT